METEDTSFAPDTMLNLLTVLARALHEAGAPAHRLEDTLQGVAEAMGLNLVVFGTPTSVMLQVDGRMQMLRVQPGDADLSRLVAVDKVGARLARGKLSAEGALEALADLEDTPRTWGATAILLAFALGSMSAAMLFGGGWSEGVLAGLLSAAVGAASGRMSQNPHHARVMHLVVAAGVALFSGLAASVFPMSPERVALAALIVFIPGLSLTTALAEMATGHLAAGTARTAGAAIVLLKLGLGTALGLELAGTLFDPVAGPLPPPPNAAYWPMVLLAGLSFGVLFQARKRDFLWIILASVLAIGFTGVAIDLLGSRVGPGLGAFVMVLFSNAQARLRDVPASVTLLPGLVLLVPGAVGFKGIQAFSHAQTLDGVNAVVEMLIVAMALVGGLLAANALLPPRREL